MTARGSGVPPYRYLLVDVDGTLFGRQGVLSERTRAALHRAVAAGITLVLATGRTHTSLLRLTQALPLPPFHRITNGGAVGLTEGGARVAYTAYLPPELWRDVVRAIEAEGLAPLVYSHRHPEPAPYYVSTLDGGAHFADYVARTRALCRHEPGLAEAEVPNVVEVAALGRDDAFEAATARLLAGFKERTRCHVMELNISGAWGRITEFFAPRTSKWRAFQALFPEAAARPEQVIAIGDEANDLEMIAAAGLGIAMGNAIPAVREAARWITADVDDDGVARALERVLDA